MNLVVDFLLIGGIVVNLLILLMLFKSKTKELPQKLLILFFSIILLYITHAYAEVHRIKLLYVSTFVFNDFIEIFIGPLIYLYIKSLFEKNKHLVKENLAHFIPAVVYVIAVSIPILISIVSSGFIFNYLEVLNKHSNLLFALFMIYLIIYLSLSIKLFYKYRNAMKFNFSTISENDFGWVRQMLIGTLVVSVFDLCLTIYELILGELGFESNLLTLISVIILLSYLGYYGVKQSKVLLPDFLMKEVSGVSGNSLKVNVLSNKDEKELEGLKLRVIKVLQNDSLYLDEDLTLNKLAKRIPITDKKLSTLLNQYMDTTFYDIVNKYRVEAVKEKLKSSEFNNLTLLGIAYDSGFKSKTSFNRIFKKETGLSPSEYKKNL